MMRLSIVNLTIFAIVSATCNYNSILAQSTVDKLDDVSREETSFPWRYLEKLQQQMEKLENRHELAIDETRAAFREFLLSAVTPASLREQLQQQETRLLASLAQSDSAQQEAAEASLRDATENVSRQLADAVRSINQQQVSTAEQTEVRLSESLEMLSARLVEIAVNRSQEQRENVEGAVRVLEEKMQSEFLSLGGRLGSLEQLLQRQNESLGGCMETMKDSVAEMWDATSSHLRHIERNMTRNLEQFQQQRLADDETQRTETANAYSRLSLKLENLASNNSQQHDEHRQLSEAAAQNITRTIGEQFESIRGNISALEQRLETYRQTQDDVLTMQTAALSQLLFDAVDNVTERLKQNSDVQQQQQLNHLQEQLVIYSSAEDRNVLTNLAELTNSTQRLIADAVEELHSRLGAHLQNHQVSTVQYLRTNFSETVRALSAQLLNAEDNATAQRQSHLVHQLQVTRDLFESRAAVDKETHSAIRSQLSAVSAGLDSYQKQQEAKLEIVLRNVSDLIIGGFRNVSSEIYIRDQNITKSHNKTANYMLAMLRESLGDDAQNARSRQLLSVVQQQCNLTSIQDYHRKQLLLAEEHRTALHRDFVAVAMPHIDDSIFNLTSQRKQQDVALKVFITDAFGVLSAHLTDIGRNSTAQQKSALQQLSQQHMQQQRIVSDQLQFHAAAENETRVRITSGLQTLLSQLDGCQQHQQRQLSDVIRNVIETTRSDVSCRELSRSLVERLTAENVTASLREVLQLMTAQLQGNITTTQRRVVAELLERRNNETTEAFAGIRQLISDRQLTLEQLISRNLLRLDERLLNVSNWSSGHQQQTDRHHSEILGNVRELQSTVGHAFNAQLTDVGRSATRQRETSLQQLTQHARELRTDVGRIAETLQSSGRELRQQLERQLTVQQRLATEVVVNLSRAVDVVRARCYSTEEGQADRTRQSGATANLLREVQMVTNRTEQERERERQQLSQMESGMARELQSIVGELRQQRQMVSTLPTARVLSTHLKSVEAMCNIAAQRMISISEEPVNVERATAGFQCYIGAQRVDPSSNSAFVWKHSTSEVAGPLTYTNWANTQPDYWRRSESCVHLFANGKWNDLMCTDNMCSICEIDLHE